MASTADWFAQHAQKMLDISASLLTNAAKPLTLFWHAFFTSGNMDIIRGCENMLMFLLIGLMAFLAAPRLPLHFKQRFLYFFNQKPYKSYIVTAWRCTLGVLLIFFVDAIRQTWLWNEKLNIAEAAQLLGEQDSLVKQEFETHMLTSQRNLYLTSFTLFLLICNQMFVKMLVRMYEYEEEIGEMKRQYSVGLPKDEDGRRRLQIEKEVVRVPPPAKHEHRLETKRTTTSILKGDSERQQEGVERRRPIDTTSLA